MAIQFPVAPGTILICDYSTGFIVPEMVKRRPAVVVSPRLPYRDKLCAVIPLSETSPDHEVAYQCRIELNRDIPGFEGLVKWAKADMVATVSLARLNLPHTARDPKTGHRKYVNMKLTPEQMQAVRDCMLHGLGLGSLTKKGE